MESKTGKSPEAGADDRDKKCDEDNQEVSIASVKGKRSAKARLFGLIRPDSSVYLITRGGRIHVDTLWKVKNEVNGVILCSCIRSLEGDSEIYQSGGACIKLYDSLLNLSWPSLDSSPAKCCDALELARMT